MSVKIGGVSFVLNGISQDYTVTETIRSMQACCDELFIVDAGSDDGTRELLLSLEDTRTHLYFTEDRSIWDSIEGPTKLSVLTNIAMDKSQEAGMDYSFLCQMDEIYHEEGISNMRAAANEGKEAYVMNRYNLFKDPYHMLNVRQESKPCSTEVIRLAKSQYRAYSDSEHIATPSVDVYKSLDSMEIFHMGYVRHKVKHLAKIRHMLVDVFKMGMDTRAENCEEFDWSRFFKEEDLLPIPKALPIYVQQWAKERYPDLNH